MEILFVETISFTKAPYGDLCSEIYSTRTLGWHYACTNSYKSFLQMISMLFALSIGNAE